MSTQPESIETSLRDTLVATIPAPTDPELFDPIITSIGLGFVEIDSTDEDLDDAQVAAWIAANVRLDHFVYAAAKLMRDGGPIDSRDFPEPQILRSSIAIAQVALGQWNIGHGLPPDAIPEEDEAEPSFASDLQLLLEEATAQ